MASFEDFLADKQAAQRAVADAGQRANEAMDEIERLFDDLVHRFAQSVEGLPRVQIARFVETATEVKVKGRFGRQRTESRNTLSEAVYCEGIPLWAGIKTSHTTDKWGEMTTHSLIEYFCFVSPQLFVAAVDPKSATSSNGFSSAVVAARRPMSSPLRVQSEGTFRANRFCQGHVSVQDEYGRPLRHIEPDPVGDLRRSVDHWFKVFDDVLREERRDWWQPSWQSPAASDRRSPPTMG